MTKKPQGRFSKLTPDVQSKITSSLAAGNYFDVSCEYAGIAVSTGHNWLARGRKELLRREGKNVKEGSKEWLDEQPFVDFLEAVSRASASVQVKAVALIQRFGEGDKDKGIEPDWRAMAWFLEHRYPKQWGKQVIETITKDLDDSERIAKIAQLIEAAKKRKGAGQE